MSHSCSHPFDSFYRMPGISYGDPEMQLTADLEMAHRLQDWQKVLQIFEQGPVFPSTRDSILFDGIDKLEEPDYLILLQAVRKHNTISSETDSQILKLAAYYELADVAWTQLQTGNIEPWSAEVSLQIAAKNNNKKIACLILENCAISQVIKNKSALTAVKSNSAECLNELLIHSAVSGIFTHSTNSSMEELLDTCDQESIWTVLLREARKNLEMAKAIGIATPSELTKEELGYLVIAATLKRDEKTLQEFLNYGPIERSLRDEAIDISEQEGYNELIPLLYAARLF